MLWLANLVVFALPGIGLLIIFILARPQEFLPLLQKVPFLHLGAALAAIGYIVDVRLHRLQPVATNTLPWVLAFLGWAVISDRDERTRGRAAPRRGDGDPVRALRNDRARHTTISNAPVHRRRAGGDVLVHRRSVCFHQGLAPTRSASVARPSTVASRASGWPAVRDASAVLAGSGCGARARVSLRARRPVRHVQRSRIAFATRGELHDPNEVALTMCAGGIALLIGFALRKRGAARSCSSASASR